MIYDENINAIVRARARFAGHLDSVDVLLKYGCDVNLKDADSRTTLYILALENRVKIVKWLLEHSNISANIPDSEGRTALHVAAWQGHVDMVKLLITQGKRAAHTLWQPQPNPRLDFSPPRQAMRTSTPWTWTAGRRCTRAPGRATTR